MKKIALKPQRVFLILVIGYILGLGGWYLLVYQPRVLEGREMDTAWEQIHQVLERVNLALHSLETTRKTLQQEKTELANIRAGFIRSQHLSTFTRSVEELAQTHRLKLVDFSPAVENFLQDSVKTPVRPLPLSMVVEGRYLDIGAFLEAWQNFPVYVTIEGIAIEKVEGSPVRVRATVRARLYTLEEQG